LHPVGQARLSFDAEVSLEALIPFHNHARTIHAAEIHWHAIRLVMRQGSADAFSRGHLSHGDLSLLHQRRLLPSDCSLALGIASVPYKPMPRLREGVKKSGAAS
jgi:hypothetical protein